MIWKMTFKEMLHHRFNSISSLFAIIIAVCLFVVFYTINKASDRETKRLTRDMGFNMRIISKGTNMNNFWLTGYSDKMIPEAYVKKFMKFDSFVFAHLTATLQESIIWQGMDLILTGISQEYEPSGKNKDPMIFSIKEDEAYVGHEVASQRKIKKGDSITLGERTFYVRHVNAETGSIDDIRIFIDLKAAQVILQKQDKINEIMALNCLCATNGDSSKTIDLVRDQLTKVLPGTKVIMNLTIANAREKQRAMITKYANITLMILLLGMGAWIGVLAMNNARARKQEIGILKALGYKSRVIASVFLLKYMIFAIFGASIGYWIGTWLSIKSAHQIFYVTANTIQPIKILFIWSIVFTTIFSLISAFIPIMIAMFQEPFKTLNND